MNNIEILEKLKDEQYDKETLKTICMFYDEDFKPYVLSTEEREAIENLIKENKELAIENVELHKEINQRIKLKLENERCVDKDFIPKSKVKEKIEVIQKRMKEETRTDFLITLKILENELQELLEEGE